ncbi:DODA-type extradiol aromatic ring-opening family dioxygenase [Aquamicrobium zhengzhouense]|uniref:Dioxygenase n=1 Tax=Aquamicrobium zhengzhouense TaxID=2781738 RepID=A0ABS0S8F8_9HYPH|nr:class III extradiol ring-cleavage dioxygenase [Aquamicrobium zhengzhouense]MBI1619578.1 dioxygenase [Aquamicrobium zhengzhouense]
MSTMPSLFISHGGPNIVIDDTPARHYLEGISGLVPAPKAIVIVSAHFEAQGATVVTDPNPGMIYDFGGFAPELYEMVYPAPGEPKLAGRVLQMLNDAGIPASAVEKRGFDHGTWTPLKLAFPEANIPVVQVSVDPDRDAHWHYALGKALAPLRDEGILLIGSGHITHNLRALFPVMRGSAAPDPALMEKVNAFTLWFADRFAENDRDAILDWKNRAPFPAENHPTDEHLMPIFFAYGAGGDQPRIERAHSSKQYGFFAWDSYLFH